MLRPLRLIYKCLEHGHDDNKIFIAPLNRAAIFGILFQLRGIHRNGTIPKAAMVSKKVAKNAQRVKPAVEIGPAEVELVCNGSLILFAYEI